MTPLPEKRIRSVMERVWRETRTKANLLASRWGATKTQIYEFLIDLALSSGLGPDEFEERVNKKKGE